MKYCSHCGKEVLDDAIICPGCGCSVQYGNNNVQQSKVQPVADTHSGLSIGGFILAFFEPLIGLILSIIAHSEAKRLGSDKSRSLSTAGIIISAVYLGILAVCVFIWLMIIIFEWVPLAPYVS